MNFFSLISDFFLKMQLTFVQFNYWWVIIWCITTFFWILFCSEIFKDTSKWEKIVFLFSVYKYTLTCVLISFWYYHYITWNIQKEVIIACIISYLIVHMKSCCTFMCACIIETGNSVELILKLSKVVKSISVCCWWNHYLCNSSEIPGLIF